ncbi:AAA-domain-containing protein [Ascodesmis nigricans]|uniref:Vesicular-fusion protein SEC18 n=1 Tax=Ascodesmis nigricans TaxID=341454 RepID=A0A4S2N3W4_9PEZI|nr:AAA-domain-containing protein [Ascodesmis nigricans]
MSNWLPTGHNANTYGARPTYPSSTPPSQSLAPGRNEYLVGSQATDWYWYNNIVTINPSDFFSEFVDKRSGATYADLLINDRYVFRVMPGQQDLAETTIPGQRGRTQAIAKPVFLSLVQRECLQASMFQPMKLQHYKGRGEEIARMEIEVKFLAIPGEDGWAGDMLDGDLLADTMTQVFQGQTLSPGMILAHMYEHTSEQTRQKIKMRLKILIKAVEVYVPNPNTEKPNSGGNVGNLSKDPRTRGRLTKDSIIEVTRGDGFNMRVTPSSKSVKSIIRHDVSFESMGIGGLDEQFNQIFRRAFASRQFPPGLVAKMGIQHVKGILLYGPPGTGKTLIARQIGKALQAREPKVVNGPEILNKYVGASEENIRKLFADAEEEFKKSGDDSELHIIIFDELDAICKQRGGKADNTGVGDSVVNQLLSKMDGVDQLNNVLIIGMTNRKDMIDEALLRPGRLEVHIEIALPDEPGRLQILTIHTNKIRNSKALGSDVDLAELASLTKNFSGAEIEGLVKSATSFAFNRHVSVGKKFEAKELVNLKVTRADFMQALEEVKPAFGVAEEEFDQCTTGGIIHFSRNIASILDEGRLYVSQVRNSNATPLVSVLLHGPPGSGKTALAASIAMASEFPFIKLVSPESMVGYNDMSKISHLTKVFMDAYKSPLNIVVIDNIERILGWVPVGPSFSNPVLQTLVTLLRKPPPKGRRLLILATSTERAVLDRLDILNCFDAEIGVPNVATLSELRNVVKEVGAFGDKEMDRVVAEVKEVTRSERLNVGVKKLLMAIETARQDEKDMIGRFVEVVRKAAVEMMVPNVGAGAAEGRDAVGEIYDGY